MFEKFIEKIRQIPTPTDKTFLEVVILILLVLLCIGACSGCGSLSLVPPIESATDWKPLVATQMGYACLESAGRDSGPQTIHAGETAGFVARMESPEY